ncbi:MAG TPA: hypothetical protein VNN08_13035, partial [Thermoanaerobaculia bacterium]|nr:hypothetical protein [Thermoanaerobaculia bacterium]
MKHLRILTSAVLLLITCSAIAADPTMPEIFKRGKDRFAAGDFKGSLADFEMLDTMSARPENAAARVKLIPV